MDYSKIGLDESFFKEEVRCEYTVPEKLKKIWAVELDLLSELFRVCEKYDIKVYGFAGTLLGAVRHGGFIPWDDDADVCLLHDDYLKLLEVAPKEFKHPYFLQTAVTDQKYFFRYARLRNSDTTGLVLTDKSPDYNNGIFIDVFVLNGVTNNKYLRKLQRFGMNITWKLCRAYIADLSTKPGMKKYIIGAAQKIERKLFKYETLVNLNWKVQSMFDKSADKVTLLTHGEKMAKKYWCKKSDLQEMEYLPFETIKLPVPKKYKAFLKHAYGNYMEFPPVSERGKWHENVIVFDPDVPYKEYLELHKDELK